MRYSAMIIGRVCKSALMLALVFAFSYNMYLYANKPKPDCSGPECSGSCTTGGGNCCAVAGDTCMCLAVNSTC